ncbi:MAG: HAD family hydrolase [Cyanobacteria bacterium TGS_CYA1]|nr:HAD family hydrolase [Cyanobacteria bacterium TGS_CYA1]
MNLPPNKPKSKRPVVFLDRDGTLNVERGYIHELENLNLIDGAADAIKTLNQNGIAAVLVTNQTGAARGYYSEDHILALNKRLCDLLAKEGAHMDGVYYCPHLSLEEGGKVEPYALDCKCRKPEIGLVEQAYKENEDLEPALSYVVGDKSTDVELAINCGAKGVLVKTGYGEKVLSGEYQWKVTPNHLAESITDAVEWILKDLALQSR